MTSQKPMGARGTLVRPPRRPPLAADEPPTRNPSQALELRQRGLALPLPPTRQQQGR